MTQEQIADATGLTAVHVNRVLKSLQSEGLIERNRRVVSFPDWDRLREVGDFDPRYLLSNYFATGGAHGRLESGATVTWDFADFPGARKSGGPGRIDRLLMAGE